MKPSFTLLAAAFWIVAGVAAAQGDAQPSSPPQSSPPQSKTRGVHVILPTETDQDSGGGQPNQPPPPRPPQPLAKCDRAFPQADLTFQDQAGFDRRLHDLLVRPETMSVVIDVSGFTSDEPPERLAAWFGEVRRTGGRVGRRDITCTRGFNFFRALGALFNTPHENILEPAKGYDAILWVDKTAGAVRQVQFVRRSTGGS